MISSGPALQRRGATFFQANANLAAGNTTLVSAGANVNGVIIRTAHLVGTNGAEVRLQDGTGQVYVLAQQGQHGLYYGSGILIPPGIALNVNSSVLGGFATLTYDVL
jgi:hypothetical protein